MKKNFMFRLSLVWSMLMGFAFAAPKGNSGDLTDKVNSLAEGSHVLGGFAVYAILLLFFVIGVALVGQGFVQISKSRSEGSQEGMGSKILKIVCGLALILLALIIGFTTGDGGVGSVNMGEVPKF